MARKAVAMLVVTLVVALASLGLAHGVWAKTLTIDGVVPTCWMNVGFIRASTDDPPGTIDPGYDKDVASCTATVVNSSQVKVLITNAYPSYTCTFTTTIYNSGTLPVRRGPLIFEVPPVFTVTELNHASSLVLYPCKKDVEKFKVHVEQEAKQEATYFFTIKKSFSQWLKGTMGFWKNWRSNKTFSRRQIEQWLTEIDATSGWLGPTTVSGMDKIFADALGGWATPKSRFLGHYLATRLNERASILGALDTHDVRGEDPGNYLGLANPASATLKEIIAAIESKYGASVSNSQFNIMKNVCDALNNLEI